MPTRTSLAISNLALALSCAMPKCFMVRDEASPEVWGLPKFGQLTVPLPELEPNELADWSGQETVSIFRLPQPKKLPHKASAIAFYYRLPPRGKGPRYRIVQRW